MKPKALFVMLILWLSFTTIQARSTEDVPDKGTYAKFLLVAACQLVQALCRRLVKDIFLGLEARGKTKQAGNA